MDFDDYCREIEGHLCRRNGGHLIRVVGPAFGTVQTWFALGVPFKVACQGIDRHVARATARGPRRRPVRIEFCDADVLDAFDEWRRAVGLRAADVAPGGPDETAAHEDAPRGRSSLPAHLERVVARLTVLRGGPQESEGWSLALDAAIRRLDAMAAPAKRARGEAREAIVAELREIDRALMAAAADGAPADVLADAAAEAGLELAPFRARLAEADYAATLERSRTRALRLRLGLPTVTLD